MAEQAAGRPGASSSPLEAVGAALLPALSLGPGGPLEDVLCLDGWRLQEVERTAIAARVTVTRLEGSGLGSAAAAAPFCAADLLWEPAPGGPHGAGRGAWLLTHVDDPSRDLTWDVYCTPGGRAWRMLPRLSPEWLRERERVVMARLRGSEPLADGPLSAAAVGTPVCLETLHAVVREQDRDRATVAYHEQPPVETGAPPRYLVRVRRRRLSLRPYRSLGFWLVEAVARLRPPGER